MQIIIGAQNGKTYSVDIDGNQKNAVNGKRIGQEFDGSVVGLDGYKLKITGGSDKDGFPMRKNLLGTARRKVLVEGGTGVRKLEKGEKRRKTMRGNTVSDDIIQLNTKVTEKGSKDIEELLKEDENSEQTEEES